MGTHPIFESDFDCLTECWIARSFDFAPRCDGCDGAKKAKCLTTHTIQRSCLAPSSGCTANTFSSPNTSGTKTCDGAPRATWPRSNSRAETRKRKRRTTNKHPLFQTQLFIVSTKNYLFQIQPVRSRRTTYF